MVLTLPTRPKISGGSFVLQRVQAANPSRGGHFQGVDLSEPLWVASVSTTPLSRAQAGEYDALFAKSRGILRTAYIYDAKRPRPIAYHDAGSGWGSPSIAAISRAASTISLTGCSAGAEWSPGDFIAWDDGPARRLHMVVDAATANGSGAVTLTVEPAPPATATATLPVAAIVEKAAAEMVLQGGTTQWTVTGLPSASFNGLQILRRY